MQRPALRLVFAAWPAAAWCVEPGAWACCLIPTLLRILVFPAPQWGAAFRLAGDAEQRQRTWRYLEWRCVRAGRQLKRALGTSCCGQHAARSSLAESGRQAATPAPLPHPPPASRLHTPCPRREKQYDQRALVPVFTPASGEAPALTALTFIATADRARNPHSLGPAPLADVAHQIATARGPSGPNHE